MIHANNQNDTAGAHTLIQNPGDGLYYGACQGGGAFYPNGCVFKMDASGNITLLHSFSGGGDGRLPTTALFLNDDGLLYGNTFNGGSDDAGGVFKLDTTGGSYVFASQGLCTAAGANPSGSFFKANDGNFYMPTVGCAGANLNGAVDKLDTTLSETEIANFNINSSTFVSPQGHLLQGADGMLYGTAPENPNIAGDRGGVYRIPLGGGDVETVHNFALGEGISISVSAPLLLASDGNFWGTTMEATDLQGSGVSTGTIFKVGEGGAFQVMHYFNGEDGRFPITGLIQASDGYLYGATEAGGAVEYGVIYRIDLSGNYTKLANIYDVNIGAGPWSELLEGSDGRL
ncbi:MAG TPA: choice-of-anchor tandem repeat GloVer-containing protein, partial [Thermoanaerobaculia bacterium]|nr:choice-of-anchor tandem repeat GloVer-containing protein [Thermoanaerobaculia bacterium]